MAEPLFYEGTGVPRVKAYSFGKTLITIGGGERLACAGADFRYERPVGYVHPLNLDEIVLVAGQPVGSLTLTVMVGPSEGVASFLRTYSNICDLSKQSIRINPKNACTSAGGGDASFTFHGLVITGISGRVSRTEAGNIMVPAIAMSFISMGV